MTLLMRDIENMEKGMAKGMAKGMEQGEDKMLALIQKLMEHKRFDDISRIREDKAYRQKLFNTYQI